MIQKSKATGEITVSGEHAGIIALSLQLTLSMASRLCQEDGRSFTAVDDGEILREIADAFGVDVGKYRNFTIDLTGGKQ